MSNLEQTATAPQGASTSAHLEIGSQFDHYVIERELGSGGMGVVYAAYDTELQRRTALKILRDGLSDQAQQRLLREARAMARLTHANVVTVYEVGSAKGRDFVAMELVDGESLADWLAAERRSAAEIVDAFIAAGRGLSAAHAAGMVHRDFKPHNVLRSRSGRVVVTDFGLARDATDPLATTLPVPSTTSAQTDSALSGLTVPGALIGTPAYMAPEQWSGGRLTPATDQFAFCVALWEALAGERPYRGPTIEALREQVTAGPDALDASKLPRRFRALLRRGLAADPDRRWPSMDALLARLGHRTRRIAIATIATAAVLATGAVVLVARSSTDERPSCRPPALAVPNIPESAAWQTARQAACREPSPDRAQRLECFDRVLARLDAVARVRRLAANAETSGLVVEPTACLRTQPPALPARYSEHAIAALALSMSAPIAVAAVDGARTAAADDPCVALYVALGDARLDDASRSAAACGDDLAIAHLALRRFEAEAPGLSIADLATRASDVQRAIDHAGRGDLVWRIDAAKAAAARENRRLDDAIIGFDTAISRAPETHVLPLVAAKLDTHLERNRRTDVETVREQVAKWMPVAERTNNATIAEQLAWMDATAQWTLGDIEGGGKRLRELHAKSPPMMPGAMRMSGVVVDGRGTPVAGATVAVGIVVAGDAISIATPFYAPGGPFRMLDVVTTDAQGRYVLEYAPGCYGALVAQRGTERSDVISATEGARLVLQPTTHVRGRVDLAGRAGMFAVSVSRASDAVFVGNSTVIAMVGSDGRFSVDGVVPGKVVIGLSEGSRSISGHGSMKHLRVGPRGLDNVVLEVPAGRELRVLVRGNDIFTGPPVFVVDGAVEAKTLGELVWRAGQHQMATTAVRAISSVPPEIAGHYRPGDLFGTFPSAPTGAATACAMRSATGCSDAIRVECVPVPANAALVTIEANKPR